MKTIAHIVLAGILVANIFGCENISTGNLTSDHRRAQCNLLMMSFRTLGFVDPDLLRKVAITRTATEVAILRGHNGPEAQEILAFELNVRLAHTDSDFDAKVASLRSCPGSRNR